MAPIRVALVGLGKISVDEHIPAIAADPDFVLVGGASPHSHVPGVQTFKGLEVLLAATEVDAVAVNTPPQLRFELARQALLAGKHVLLEKPPCASVAQVEALERLAGESGVTLYTGWHSQHAPTVAPARDWLQGRELRQVTVTWCENVRQWHPGQAWIWQPGGLGVFDPGINALSILTTILPADLVIERARFEIPGNCHTPIAAELSGRVGPGAGFAARLDFLQTGLQTWSIEVETDRGTLTLAMGGAELSIDDVAQPIGRSREYASIYRRFAELIREGRSEVDKRPLALTADAFLVAERIRVADFVE